jgi:hypothetical protein
LEDAMLPNIIESVIEIIFMSEPYLHKWVAYNKSFIWRQGYIKFSVFGFENMSTVKLNLTSNIED